MKKIILLLIVLLIISAIGCSNGDIDIEKTASPIVTEIQERTNSPEPSPRPTKEPLSEDKFGLPYDGADLIYESNFQEEELDDDLVIQKEFFSFANGKLYLASTDGGETYDNWDCVCPVFDCHPDDAYQWEFHIQFEATYPKNGGSVWDATFIGARVGNYTTAIADQDDGIWVAFSSAKKATIYPSGTSTNKQWPDGAITIDIGEAFDIPKKLILVDTGPSLFYYIDKDGENLLLLRIDITDEEVIIFNDQGDEKYRGVNYLNMDMGSYFKVFTHSSGTAIDYMAIKSY